MVRSFLDIPYIHTFFMRVCSVSCVLFLFYYPHILYGFLEKWKWKKLCEPFSWSPMWNYQGWLSENRSESIYFTVEMTVDKSKRWPWGLEPDLRFIPCFLVWPSVIFTVEFFRSAYYALPDFIAVTTTVVFHDIPRFNLGLHLTPYLKNCDQKIIHGKFLYLSIRFEYYFTTQFCGVRCDHNSRYAASPELVTVVIWWQLI